MSMSAEQSAHHPNPARQPHAMYGSLQLPPLPPNASLPIEPQLPTVRLPSLKRAADRTPPSSNASSPESSSSPDTTLSGLKRLCGESRLSAATASATRRSTHDDGEDDHSSTKSEAPSPTPRESPHWSVESDDIFISGTYKAPRKPTLNATHELRALRHDAARMAVEIDTLVAHWRTTLPDNAVLLRACEAAKSKWVTAQAEALNQQLKEQLLQQQLYLASLQHLVLQSPFFAHSRSKEVFDALHTPLTLHADMSDDDRREQLRHQCATNVRLAPAIADRFVRAFEAQATVKAPFSHSSIMCDGTFTYASNLLVCRIPHASLTAVAAAVGVYFATLPLEARDHVGVATDFRLLDQLSPASHYAQLRYTNGPDFVATSNTTFATSARTDDATDGPNDGPTDESVVFVADFVDDDARFPLRRPAGDSDRSTATPVRRTACVALVLTPTVDVGGSGQRQILLRRVTVTRYDLPPNARLVHHDVQTTQQWTNGDLLLKVVCHELNQQLRQVVAR